MTTLINLFSLLGETVEAHRVSNAIFLKHNPPNERYDQLTQDEFNKLLCDGILVPLKGRRNETVVTSLSAVQRIKLDTINCYLTELKQYSTPCSDRTLRRVISSVSSRIRDPKPPSQSTLYSWFRKDRESGLGLAGTFAKRIQPNRGPYASEAVTDLALSVFDDHYLKLNGTSAAECYSIFFEEFQQNKTDCVVGFSANCPSKATFYRWKDRMLPKPDVVAARQGGSAARAYTRNVMRQFKVEDMLDRVEIDALTINIGIKDEFGNTFGPIILYTAIDVFTRMIIGYHIQLDRGESASGFIHCLRHAFNVKPTLDESGLRNNWPAYGVPSTIVADPSAAIQSLDLQTFIYNIKSTLIITQAGQGWKKPFIERWFGTLRTQFLSKLPGYAGKRTDQKAVTIDMKRHATMSLDEFETLLLHYIVDDYHQRPHAGLHNQTPHQVWTSRLQEMPVLLPIAINKLAHIGGKTVSRTLKKEGIEVNSTFYNSNELQRARHDLPEQDRTIEVHIDTEDIGSITVLLPSGDVIVVPAINYEIVKGISKAQWDVLRKQGHTYSITTQSSISSENGVRKPISSSELLIELDNKHDQMIKERAKNKHPRPQARQEVVNQSADTRQKLAQGLEERNRRIDDGFNPISAHEDSNTLGGFDID